MSRSQPVLEAKQLVIGYEGQAICAPVDLYLAPGNGIGIIGSNGSGKSSLLRSILGMQPVLTGSAHFDGNPLDEGSAEFRSHAAIQVVDGNFFEELTVAEHLELVARGHELPNWAAAVSRELEFFELGGVSGNIPSELSSGQRRKVLLAAALIRPAKLLIFDEPEQRLDFKIRQRFYQRIAEMREGSVSVLAVTHDPKMLRSCLSSVLLIDDGQTRALSAVDGANWLER